MQLYWGGGVEHECPHEMQLDNELKTVGNIQVLDHNPLASEQAQLLKNAEAMESAAMHGQIATSTNPLENSNDHVTEDIMTPEMGSADESLVKEQSNLLHEANIIENRVEKGGAFEAIGDTEMAPV